MKLILLKIYYLTYTIAIVIGDKIDLAILRPNILKIEVLKLFLLTLCTKKTILGEKYTSLTRP